MFSSLSKYARPKQLLASSLAKSLAEFFNVDPNKVETNLLQDAKVALHDIDIRERRIGSLLVGGSVELIEFSWAWDTQSLITDVRLIVKGVRIHVHFLEDECTTTTSPINAVQVRVASTSRPEAKAVASTTTSTTKTNSDWKTRYMQQIIDHMTLVVTDVEIAIHLHHNTSQIVVKGSDIELRTLSKDQSLLQTISMASLQVWMDTEDGVRYPILDPFGYRANVQRVSGRRFLDGVLSGLFIQGDTTTTTITTSEHSRAPSTIRVYAGIQQIAGLSRLQQILLSVGEESGERTSTCAGNDEVNQSLSDGSILDENGATCAEQVAGAINSVFCLPIQAMEVVLENTTTLRLAGCTIRYCTDGSELSVDCMGGIWMDDTPLFKNNRLVLDMVTSELVLDSLQQEDQFYDAESSTTSQEGDHPDFRMDLSLEMFEKLYTGVQAILPQCTKALAVVVAEKAIDEFLPSLSESPTPWVMKVNGSVAFRFTGNDNLSVEVSAKAPVITQGEGASPFCFACQSIHIRSTVGGGFSISVPEIRTVDGTLVLQNSIDATVESMVAITSLQSLWNQVIEVVGDTNSTSRDVPIGLSLPEISILVKKPEKSMVELSSIRAEGSIWKVGRLQVKGFGDVYLEALSLEATLAVDKISVNVHEILKGSLGDVGYLRAPICDTHLVLDNSCFSVACKAVQVTYAIAQSDSSGETSVDRIVIPLMVHVTFDSLTATSDSEQSFSFEGLDIQIQPKRKKETPSTVHLLCESAKGKALEKITFSCSNIQATAGFHDTEPFAIGACQPVSVPALGLLRSAQVKIREVSDLSIVDSGRLAKPTTDVSITFKENRAILRCNMIHLQCLDVTELKFGDKQTPGTEQSFLMTIPVQLHFSRIMIMPEFGAGKPGLCLDGVQLDVLPNPATRAVTITAVCNYLQGRGPDQSDLAAKGIKIEAVKTNKPEESNIGIQKATLSIKEISTLRVSGVFSLAKPVHDSLIRFEDDCLLGTCGSIDLVLYFLTENGTQNRKYEEKTDSSQHSPSSSLSLFEIPIPVRFTVRQLWIKSVAPEADLEKSLHCDQVWIESIPASEMQPASLRLQCNSLRAQSGASIASAMSGIHVSTKWKSQCVDHREESLQIPQFGIPGLGVMTFASVEIDVCSEFRVNGFGSLVDPTLKAKILFHDNSLSFTFDEISVKAEDGSATGSEMKAGTAMSEMVLGIPILLHLNRLNVKSARGTEYSELSLSDLRVDCRPVSLGNYVSLRLDQLDARGMGGNALSAKKSSLKLVFAASPSTDGHNVPSGSELKLIAIPIVGYLQMALLEIDEIPRIDIGGAARLVQPLSNLKVKFENDEVFVNLQTLYIEAANFKEKSPTSEGKIEMVSSEPSLNILDFVIHLDVMRVVVMPTLTVGGPGLCMERVNIDFGPRGETAQGSINFECGALQAVGATHMGLMANEINADVAIEASGEPSSCPAKVNIPYCGTISEATIKITSVSKLCIPNLGSLRRELFGTTIVFGQDGLRINLGDVSWALSPKDAPVSDALNGTKSDYLVQIPIQVLAETIRIEDEPNLFACCEELSVSITSDPFDASSRVSAQCIALHGESFGKANVVATDLQLTALFVPSGLQDEHMSGFRLSAPGLGCLSSVVLQIHQVSDLTIPNVVRLATPIQNLSLRFDGEALYVDCPSVSMHRELSTLSFSEDCSDTGKSSIDLPFNLKISIQEASLQEAATSSGTICCRKKCEKLNLVLEPVLARILAAAKEGPGAGVYLKCENFESAEGSTVVRIPSISASGLVQFAELDRIGNLTIAIDGAELSADFSSVSWSTSVEESSAALEMPFAVVQKFDLTMKYIGSLVNIDDATFCCETFEGDIQTTLDSLISHYVRIGKRRVPYLLSKANLVGANVGDSVGMIAGKAITHSSVIGSTVGVVARDAVGAAITKGKETRGASSTEKYRFGK
jgi:hypothetical protein